MSLKHFDWSRLAVSASDAISHLCERRQIFALMANREKHRFSIGKIWFSVGTDSLQMCSTVVNAQYITEIKVKYKLSTLDKA